MTKENRLVTVNPDGSSPTPEVKSHRRNFASLLRNPVARALAGAGLAVILGACAPEAKAGSNHRVELPLVYRGAIAQVVDCPEAPTELQPNITFGNPEDLNGRPSSPLGGARPALLSWRSSAVRYDITVQGTAPMIDARDVCPEDNTLCLRDITVTEPQLPSAGFQAVSGGRYAWTVTAKKPGCAPSKPAEAVFAFPPGIPTDFRAGGQVVFTNRDGAVYKEPLSWEHPAGVVDTYHLVVAEVIAGQEPNLFAVDCLRPKVERGEFCADLPKEAVSYRGDWQSLKNRAYTEVPVKGGRKYASMVHANANGAGRGLATQIEFTTPKHN